MMTDWKYFSLNDVLSMNQSGTWGDEGTELNSPVLRSTNIQNYKLILEGVEHRKVKNIEKFILENGDIIVSKSSGSQHLIGKCCVFRQPNNAKNYLFSNFTQRLRVSDKILSDFLYYYLISPQAKNALKKISETTSGLRNLNVKEYLKQKIPVPPISIQKRIIELLKTTEEIRDNRKLTHNLLDELLKSFFLKTFGDPFTNPMKWDMGNLSTVVNATQYGTSNILDKEKGVPCLRMNNITDKGYMNVTKLKYLNVPEQIQKYQLKKGDILFNRTNSRELVGKTSIFVLDEKFVFAGYLIRITTDLKKCNPYFLCVYMNLESIKKSIHSMAIGAINQANINAQKIQELEIYLPPIELQNEFQKFYLQLYALMEKLDINNDYDLLYSSMLYDVFEGKIIT
jgi:type I restriction enzyme, S subunit